MIIPNGTHGLNPFRARPAKQATQPNVAMGNQPGGGYDAFDARGLAIKLPIMVAGWGYDIFGRPAPSKADTLSLLNSRTNDEMGYYGFANNNDSDLVGTPAPYGAEVPIEKFVGGALDIRYNQRHGVWQTDHSFFAKIIGVNLADSSKKYSWVYEWEEIEIFNNPIPTESNAIEHFNRSLSNPAKGKAVNIAEIIDDTGDKEYSYLRKGTVIELKAHLALKPTDTSLYEPVYLFNHPINYSVFLRINWDSSAGYPAPLSASDANYGNEGNFNMCNRFLYQAEVVYFDELLTAANQKAVSPFGGFKSFNPAIFVQCINLTEWGNPIGSRGVVAPGIILATGALNATAGNNLVWTGSSVAGNGSYPSGFAIKPIWHNTIVEGKRMQNQKQETLNSYGPLYYFEMPNAHDGACATGAWPAFNYTQDSTKGEHIAVKRQNSNV